jgi:hypothetical protein
MNSPSEPQSGRRTGAWIALTLCAATVAARTLAPVARGATTPDIDWTGLVATGFAAIAALRPDRTASWPRLERISHGCALLLMIWLANGLPFDLLRLTRLIPLPIDWAAVGSRSLACAAAVVLTRLLLARRADAAACAAPRWPAYTAFVLALPYPVLRTIWAFGGTLGLDRPDAGGHGWLPWLACLPWLMAAALSLLLVHSPGWMPRRLLVGSGWLATAFVALIGPGACWVLVTKLAAGASDLQTLGMAAWVPCLFYGSWLLWAVAAGVATHTYQRRTAPASARERGAAPQNGAEPPEVRHVVSTG